MPVEEVYGFAVAFATDIDGVPVIGSGGKMSVHLGAGLRPVSYETSIVPVTKKRGTVSADTLLNPDKAEAQAWERLAATGLGPSTHELTSRQFGYLRRGRGSIQKLIAPAYAFFFFPTSDPGKKRIEVISAVTDPALAGELEADERAEQARKALLEQPDER